MGRNIQKEKEWAKTKYIRILGDIDKELGEELKKQLNIDGISIASWITSNAKRYLDEKKRETKY